MENIQFYKLSFELKSKEHRKNINLMEKVQEIVDAKDVFNTKSKGRKYLVLLSLTKNVISVVLRINGASEGKVDIRAINRFISVLQNDFDWREFLDRSTRRLFESKIIKALEPAECKKLAASILENENLGTNGDVELLLKGVAIPEEEDDYDTEDDTEDYHMMGEAFTCDTLSTALSRLDALTGYPELKREIVQVRQYVELNEKLNINNHVNTTPIFPFHYIFKGHRGMNQLQAAKILAEVYFHLGILQSRNCVVINVPEQSNTYNGINIDHLVKEEDTGVVFLENLFECDRDNVDEKKVLRKLLWKMHQQRGKVIYITSCWDEKRYETAFRELCEAYDKMINFRQIEFPFYREDELAALILRTAEKKQYTISPQAGKLIADIIKKHASQKDFDVDTTIEKVIEKAIGEKKFKSAMGRLQDPAVDLQCFAVLGEEDFSFLEREATLEGLDADPFLELDEMIGLKEVKARVKQIADFVKVQMKKKELGMSGKQICMHMAFVGNPGTGKTTVARIVGRILKQLGFLSSGHFTEVTRDHLVGPYIGQTTPKVNKIVDSSKDGILFIDEAYSLNGHAENDYGHEVLASFVKAMEEYKDEMVFIYAGYEKEMDEMIGLNPGMRDRIAFRIVFPDYNAGQLVDIFKKMSKDCGYVMEEEAAAALEKLFGMMLKNKPERFGNGRVVRRVFERTEMLQNGRICREALFEKEEIQMIKAEDIRSLYEDTEVMDMMKGQRGKMNIGFAVP